MFVNIAKQDIAVRKLSWYICVSKNVELYKRLRSEYS
jgi:hypothetical protein